MYHFFKQQLYYVRLTIPKLQVKSKTETAENNHARDCGRNPKIFFYLQTFIRVIQLTRFIRDQYLNIFLTDLLLKLSETLEMQ